MSISKEAKDAFDAAPWTGKTKRYDIVKEGSIAFALVAIVAIFLSLF